jgi:hypothetical protein
MRIEVSVPGIRKERGKLPAPIILGPLRLASPLPTGRPIGAEQAELPPEKLPTGAEIRESVVTDWEHPIIVSATDNPAIAAATPILPFLNDKPLYQWVDIHPVLRQTLR